MPNHIEPGRSEKAGQLAGVRTLAAPATSDWTCRCGTRVCVGENSLSLAHIPPSLWTAVSTERFCSPACLRAYLLELLEVLECTAAPGTIADFHELYTGLREFFERAHLDTLAP